MSTGKRILRGQSDDGPDTFNASFIESSRARGAVTIERPPPWPNATAAAQASSEHVT